MPSVSASFVNDNWVVIADVGPAGLSAGDTVRNDADTINPGTIAGVFGTDAFSSINTAIANTAASGTVNVLEGTYAEQVTVNKSLTVRGVQAGADARTRTGVAETILDGTTNGGRTPISVTANDVTIDGFTVQGATNPNQFGFGILLGAGTSGAHVVNNIIQNNIVGISLANTGVTQAQIRFNLIQNNNQPGPVSGTGIYTDQFNAGGTLSNVLIDSNRFAGHADAGLDFSSTDATKPATGITISNNVFDANGRGLLAFNLTSSSVTGNTFSNSTASATADIRLFEGVSGLTITRNVLENGAGRAVRISNIGTGSANATGVAFTYNSVTGYTGPSGTFQVDAGGYTGTLDATANWWGSVTGPTTTANPGGTGATLDDAGGVVDSQPWLLYGDADTAQVGFQIPQSFTVNAQTGGFTSTNNNYRRLVNAIDPLLAGQTVVLAGNFDWTEANAAASWALGNDGVAATGDDYTLSVRPGLNNVTLTAASLGAATIQGPGDVPTANLEGVFNFNGGPGATDDNQGWTISNLTILDFDLSIGMFSSGAGTDAFNNTTITNNRVRLATDLNAVAAPADVNQNIGIYYSFGTNQTISNNLIEIPGDGVSDPSADLTSNRKAFSSSVGVQCDTSGGNVYDGLHITGNTIHVLHAQNATNPQRVIGIWENAHAHTSNITVSGNHFVNDAVGNDPATNLDQAFWITSHSGATTTVSYSGNTVQGANIGFKWLGDPEFPGVDYSGNQAVQLTGNTLTNVQTGFLVQSNGLALLNGNTLIGTTTGTGLEVLAGSKVAVLGGSFKNTGVGIDVNGGTVLVQNTDLNNDGIAGLRVRNNGQVDAGGGGYTGLGTSTGGNDFPSYLPAGPGRAIIDLNADGGFTGAFSAAPPDVRAQGNTFATSSLALIEQVVDHDVDNPARGFVDFSNPTAGGNVAPVVNDQSFTVPENSPNGTPVGQVAASDANGNPLTYSIIGGNTGGAFAINPITGQITVANAGALDFETSPTFMLTVQVSDSLLTDTATVTVGLTNVNEAPVAQTGVLTTAENRGAMGTLVATDVDGPALTYSLVDVTGAHGVVTITNASTGAYSYTPDLHYSGPASFTFRASDGTLVSNTAAVNITVTAPALVRHFAVADSSGVVRVYNANGTLLAAGNPFAVFGYSGPIRVATGDLTGDGVDDFVFSAVQGRLAGLVEVLDGANFTIPRLFFPFPGFGSGMNVAIGDVNADGFNDLVLATASGASLVQAYDVASGQLLSSFFAAPGYTGGLSLAVADVDGVGADEIIVGAASGPPAVAVFTAAGQMLDLFLAYTNGYAGGVNVAAGDVLGADGKAEILVAPAAGGANGLVELFTFGSHTPLAAAAVPLPGPDRGVRVAVHDVDGDGDPDLVFAPAQGRTSRVLAFDLNPVGMIRNFDASPGSLGGVYVG